MRVTTRIRRLFLWPQPTYDIPQAAKLLGMTRTELRGWLEVGEVDGTDTVGGVVLEWGELVSFARGFWEDEQIEEALGTDLAQAIPELLQLADLEVRVPRLEIVALQRLAAREDRSVSAFLSRELLDLMSAHSSWLSAEVPGFAEALAWPDSCVGSGRRK
ncbi:MAG: hypothetical protein JWN02_2213 [Acidobacteria bacterium]|nr:hypothetical protein [Acidobacteriota bacterium]